MVDLEGRGAAAVVWRVPRLLVAGTHSGVGKTTVTLAILAGFRARGLRVAAFKAGPDFIDPSYHALLATGPSRNLDSFLAGRELLAPLFLRGAVGADVAVVEGAMGLFDGASGAGELASTAEVAKALNAPVVLVVDASGASRSVAAMVHGFATFDPGVRVRGVVLNGVGSAGHVELVEEALRPLGVRVLGALPRDVALALPERHLGLVPAGEALAGGVPGFRSWLESFQALAPSHLDLDGLLAEAMQAPPLASRPWEPAPPSGSVRKVRLAVAGGPAFTFYYPENLELLEACGAEICFFDPLTDRALPEGTRGVYVGGGFPELHAEGLSGNAALLERLRGFARSGGPVLAECGGLLFLCRELEGVPMAGVVPAVASLGGRPDLGYRVAEAARDSPFARKGQLIRGHEFHYARVEPASGPDPAWRLASSHLCSGSLSPSPGAGGWKEEGFVIGGVLATFLHTHWAAFPWFAESFVAEASRVRGDTR